LSLFNELKRRNVFRVTVGYVVSSWLLVQVADVVLENIVSPDWVMQTIMLVLALGFPVVVFFSWAYEVTPEGIKRESEIDRSQSITHVTGRKLDRAITVVLVVALAYFAYDKFVSDSAKDEELLQATTEQLVTEQNESVEPDKSIAVLAFVNMSADPEQEYFSDGIAEEILNGLAQLPDLRVAARTSAFSFKGQNIDIRQVGETLNVNYVLEGSVRKAGDRLRITAQLISVADGYHLWSETYARQVDDIFTIQEEIARAVVGELEVTLGLAKEASLVQQGTTNTEAYNWFLRGKFYIGQQSPEAFEKATESYSRAIELDPGFAGGHGGLAYGLAYGAFFFPYSQVAETVRPAYRRALEIDENQTEALLAKAVDAVASDYNFAEAEQAVRKALQTGKNRTLVTDAYWWLILQPQRRFDEALDLLAIAEKSDPLSPLIQQGFGSNLIFKREYQAALPHLETALEMNPNDSFAAWLLSLTHVRLDQLDEAEAAIGQLEALTGTNAWSISTWAELYLARGDETSARDMLAQVIALHDAGSEDPALVPMIGMIYWYLGEVEEAINWFERGTETPNLNNTAFIPIWLSRSTIDRNHPRLQALLKKMNLDDASVATTKAAAASKF
jgi:TolB-like protein/cytochrome c-type biogenesis protein CcmH/NrfG